MTWCEPRIRYSANLLFTWLYFRKQWKQNKYISLEYLDSIFNRIYIFVAQIDRKSHIFVKYGFGVTLKLITNKIYLKSEAILDSNFKRLFKVFIAFIYFSIQSVLNDRNHRRKKWKYNFDAIRGKHFFLFVFEIFNWLLHWSPDINWLWIDWKLSPQLYWY